MNWLKKILKQKAFTLTVGKGQKELLEFFITNKTGFDDWVLQHQQPKVRFQFYYPTAIDFYFGDFKLFTAYFKREKKGRLELIEMKMSETNFDTIRCASWTPFEDVIIEFLTSLEEGKKIALFEKRKVLYEYENLCAKKAPAENASQQYLNAVASSSLQALKTSG